MGNRLTLLSPAQADIKDQTKAATRSQHTTSINLRVLVKPFLRAIRYACTPRDTADPLGGARAHWLPPAALLLPPAPQETAQSAGWHMCRRRCPSPVAPGSQ